MFKALIPARGGSSLKNKNIRDFRGKPLIRHTIDAAKESGIFDDIVVSSDSDDILSICDDVTLLKRDPAIAQDDTPMNAVIADFIKQFDTEIIILLQPTSPLRNSTHIKSAVNEWGYCPRKLLMSVYKISSLYLKSVFKKDNKLFPVYSGVSDRRQDLPDLFMPNGAIYLFSKTSFLENNCLPKDDIEPFIMSELESLDVDLESDFDYR